MKKFFFTLSIGLISLVTMLASSSLYANVNEKPERKSLATVAARDQAKAGYKNLFREQMLRQFNRGAKKFMDYTYQTSESAVPFNVPQARVVGDTKIYGSVIAANNWGLDEWDLPAVKYGVYSIMPSTDKAMTEVALDKNMCANGGGVLIGDSYYVLYYFYLGEFEYTRLRQYDIHTWEEINMIDTTIEHVSNDMTYDPVTGNVYGCFFTDDMTQCVWGTFDVNTATRTIIAPIAEPLKAVAANVKGEIYAIGNSGILYSVEKTTGDLTKIGETGVTPYYLGSGVIDPRSNKFYWFAYPEDNSAHLYEVNLNTAELTEICQLENYEEVVGAIILNPLAADGAPDEVSNFEVDYNGVSTVGDISFTLPAVTYAGEPLDQYDILDYTILINDGIYTIGRGLPESDILIDEVPVNGAPNYFEFTVYVSNKVGKGVEKSIKKWIGVDVPNAVENVKLRKGAGDFELNLSWEAPETTQNGGAIDGELNYTIVRYPDNVVVASNYSGNSFNETVQEKDDIVKYYYEITAYGGQYKGAVATSNSVAIGMTTVPFKETFDTKESLDSFTVLNSNNDDQTWEWYEGSNWVSKICYVRCKYSLGYTTPMDDWLITPGIKMEKGKIYEFAFDAQTQYYVHVERLSAHFGIAPDPESMVNELVAPTDITKEEFGDKFCVQFTVPADGVYYFGIHGISEPDRYFLGVDNISIEEGPSTECPATVKDLKVEADPLGANKATISFTAPSTNLEGNNLTDLSGVDLYRGDTKIATLTPTIGEQVTYLDNNATHGFNTYMVIAFNSAGTGFESEAVTSFVGIDTPSSPQNPSATTSGNSVTVSWSAPTTGVNGGYFDAQNMTYTIKTSKGVLIAEGLTDFSYTVTPNLENMQDLVTYYIYAVTPSATSAPAATNRVIVGTPYTLPFKESFPNADETYYPWTVESLQGGAYAAWYTNTVGVYPTVSAQDGDNGLVSFVANNSGYEARFISPRITLGGVEHPTLEFYYYFLQGCQDCSLKVEVSVNGGAWEEVSAIDMHLNEGGTGWYKHSASLAKYKDEESIRIALRGRCDDPNPHYTHVDNIQIRNVIEHDLRITEFEVPVRVQVGKQNIIKVGVENIGGNVATGYSVDLYADDVLVNSVAGPELATDYYTTVELEFNPTIDSEEVAKLYAIINYTADLDLSNNRSADQFTFVRMPDYPAIDDLAGELVEEGVELTWTEPEPTSADDGIYVIEEFEDYESFIIENIGNWSLYDGNGTMTYGISNVLYPHVNEPAAFQVFNPAEIGLSTEYWKPYSGEQLLVSWCAGPLSAADPTVPVTDHWLISPLLPGNAQTISFVVKSPTDTYGLESFSVYYSTTGIAKENFVKIETPITKAPLDWTEVTVDLPQGTKYFAIVHDSHDSYALMVDDIAYTSAAEEAEELGLVGYNVYRDGIKITSEPIVDNFYLDETIDPTARYEYKVTVVYDKGESAYSNVVVINHGSVGSLGANDVRVVAGQGNIRIINANGLMAKVISADGKIIFDAVADNETIYAEPGVYAVVIGSKTIKVRVK